MLARLQRTLRNLARVPTQVISGLGRAATHVSLNRLRDRKRRPEGADHELVLQIANQDEPEQHNLAVQLLDRIFGREPASTRVMATLHYVDGMTLEEVAVEMAMSVSLRAHGRGSERWRWARAAQVRQKRRWLCEHSANDRRSQQERARLGQVHAAGGVHDVAAVAPEVVIAHALQQLSTEPSAEQRRAEHRAG